VQIKAERRDERRPSKNDDDGLINVDTKSALLPLALLRWYSGKCFKL
jgi:hypothetical protein